MNFVGRTKELAVLNGQYQSGKFEFTVLYGRRRVGKTLLLQKFVEHKEHIYYMALEAGTRLNLASLSRQVHSFMKRPEGLAPYLEYEDLFNDLALAARNNRLVFIIDEYPYLATASPELSSLIQRFCDHTWKDTKLHLILCGSAMSFMENQILGVKSPLYGRRTAQIKLKPFTFFETEKMLGSMSKENKAILHCATGGVADYLSYVDTHKALEENLLSLFFMESGRLYEEPANLLKQELREPKLYNDILDVIANGASKNNDIAAKIGVQSGGINKYLEALIELGIVKKEMPIGAKGNRKTIYRIEDASFRFWYRYVLKNKSAIALGLGMSVIEKKVKPDLSTFMGQGFETICYDMFDKMNARRSLPDIITSRGRWWGNNPALKREEEIDVVGFGSEYTIFAESKWTNEKVDIDVLHLLQERSKLITCNKKYYILFSKSGFTSALIRHAKTNTNIKLVGFL